MSADCVSPAPAEAIIQTPRKRTHEGDLVTITPGSLQGTDMSKPSNSDGISRHASPAPSNASSELTELTSTGIGSPATIKFAPGDVSGSCNPDSASTPAKKRKLTFAEREVERAVKKREKEEKAKQRAEEKARKDEEKRLRDEERRRKEEEKEADKRAKELEKAAKKMVRDAEKQEKEAEKAKKEAEKKEKELEKLKKEKSQLRIGAFFGRPAPQSTPPTTPDDVSSRTSSRRSSIIDIDLDEPVLDHDTANPVNPEFEKYIIPYFVHENTDVAPTNRFRAARRQGAFGGQQSAYELEVGKHEIEPLRTRFRPARRRIQKVEPVRQIVERVQAAQVDSVNDNVDYSSLQFATYKILSFREDVRPPYIGTYTKPITPRITRKLSRRPTHRSRPDTNYDYDSEAEWEAPAADDEEILDDEMSESEDGEEEMEDFLDDEDDQGRRRIFAGEMEPISSGLCFQGEKYDSNGHNMDSYRMDVLHDSTTFPIDPFSTAHWTDVGKPNLAKTKSDACDQIERPAGAEVGTKAMPPPRVPLATVNPPNTLSGYLVPGSTVTVSQCENATTPAKQRGRVPNGDREIKMIPSEFMDAFKQAINGSDLTKAGLIEILKKQFPKCSKDAIKDTLGMVAVRVGKKEADKKWSLV